MAKTIITTVTDDITGEADAETIAFALEGIAYSIDLAPTNRAAIREALEPYIVAGSRIGRVGNVTPIRAPRESTTNGHDPAVIREWANANGVPLADRGRIPTTVVAEYERSLLAVPTPRKRKAAASE